MTDNNELRAQRDLQSAFGRITIAGPILPDPRSEIIVRHNNEIESLKTKIQEKDEEILRLNREINRLRAENDRKDKKIEQLENRIEELENDKTDLQTRLDSVQVELVTVRQENKASREMVDNLERKLNKEVTRLKEENKASRKAADEMSKKVDEITSGFQFNEDENRILKKKIKELEETVRNQTSSLYLPHGTEQAIEKANLHLAEMCSQIQAMMYQSVLPDSYDDKNWYQIERIEADIEIEITDTRPKEEAKRRWADLKKTLKWDQNLHLPTIISLKGRRNKFAHPFLNETVLTESLDVMKGNGAIGPREIPRVEELIHMWKTLKHRQ